ncbi:hypothetical protein HYR69_02400 [Candidatus Sumerlaeota bacterium]|nr:hypothetical protein [Candidatus Sumerlaeota bacterium]
MGSKKYRNRPHGVDRVMSRSDRELHEMVARQRGKSFMVGDTKVTLNPSVSHDPNDRFLQVFAEFARPYLPDISHREGYEAMFFIAGLAWNASFMPPEGREPIMAQMRGVVRDPAGADGLEVLFNRMIERRIAEFAQHRVLIRESKIRWEGELPRLLMGYTMLDDLGKMAGENKQG